MKGQTVVLCGRCASPPVVPDNPRKGDAVHCPQCGVTDTVSRVLSQARHHATHEAARALEKRRRERGERLKSRVPSRFQIKAPRWISGRVDD